MQPACNPMHSGCNLTHLGYSPAHLDCSPTHLGCNLTYIEQAGNWFVNLDAIIHHVNLDGRPRLPKQHSFAVASA